MLTTPNQNWSCTKQIRKICNFQQTKYLEISYVFQELDHDAHSDDSVLTDLHEESECLTGRSRKKKLKKYPTPDSV